MAVDRDAVIALTLEAYGQYASALPDEAWEGYRKNIVERLSGDEPAQRIVAEREGVLVGSVLLIPPDDAAGAPNDQQDARPEVRLLAVAPESRGQGVATALMAECVRRAREAGARALGLHTTDVMAVAQGMYVRMGFERDPATDFHPAEGIHIKGYRLDLGR
jgi:GNAT superfamily N-acetyltransferase